MAGELRGGLGGTGKDSGTPAGQGQKLAGLGHARRLGGKLAGCRSWAGPAGGQVAFTALTDRRQRSCYEMFFGASGRVPPFPAPPGSPNPLLGDPLLKRPQRPYYEIAF